MMREVLARSNDGEGVKSGPIGLAVILLLCIAAYFLFKSMSKHLKNVRDDFPVEPPASRRANTPAATVDPAQPPAVEPAALDPAPARKDADTP